MSCVCVVALGSGSGRRGRRRICGSEGQVERETSANCQPWGTLSVSRSTSVWRFSRRALVQGWSRQHWEISIVPVLKATHRVAFMQPATLFACKWFSRKNNERGTYTSPFGVGLLLSGSLTQFDSAQPCFPCLAVARLHF
eukprot:2907800-Rhodomonas_salina.1